MIFVHQRRSKSECAPALYSNFFQLQPLSSKCAAPLISSLLRMHQIIFGEKNSLKQFVRCVSYCQPKIKTNIIQNS